MAGHHSPEKAAKFAIRARMNHEAMLYFLAAIVGMASVFILYHLLRVLAGKTSHRNSKGRSSPPLAVARKIRSVLIRKAPALPSFGHAGLVSLYVATNIILIFAHVDYKNVGILSNLGSRTGWLAIANMVFVVFLALKNTPLAFLTSWSYERLNVLHQVSGYMTLIHVILHVSLYCSYFIQAGRPSRLLYTDEIFGMVAGLCFLGLAFSGAVVRRWWYELFYYMHICFWTVGVVTVGLHQPEFGNKIILVTCVTGGIWGMDRLLRLTRILMYSVSNEVTLQPLSNGGTRVTLKKPPLGAMPGKHCFLWIPKIRFFETHPFTIAATDPMEFVIASYDGFTNELHQYATRHPGVSLKASVDGSYGTFPAVDDCDKMILVAGGSGASFTFGTALNALQKMKADDRKTIIFVWIVKQHSQLAWFARHIKTLESDDRVSVRLYVTRPPELEDEPVSPSESLKTEFPAGRVIEDPEKDDLSTSEVRRSIDFEKGGNASDSDACSSTINGKMTATHSHIADVPIMYRRPDVADIIRSTIIDETPVDRRVLVMGCGPDGLMRTVRDTSAACIRTEGPAVEVHCEQFGW